MQTIMSISRFSGGAEGKRLQVNPTPQGLVSMWQRASLLPKGLYFSGTCSCTKLTDVPDEEAGAVVLIFILVLGLHHQFNGQGLLGSWASDVLLACHRVLLIVPLVHCDLLCRQRCCSTCHCSGLRGTDGQDRNCSVL